MTDNWSTMPLNFKQGALAEGLACYRRHDFFETHEHWETVWVLVPEPEKRFLQGLIHVAVAFHHLQSSNPIGAARQLKRAMLKLNAFPPEFEGIHVENVRANIRTWLEALEDCRSTADLPYPPV